MEEMFPRKLPPVYKRNEKDCYLDPIRKKLIYITPEETIRQRVLSYLTDTLHVPIQEIILEQHLSHYGIKSKKRADYLKKAVEILLKYKADETPVGIVKRAYDENQEIYITTLDNIDYNLVDMHSIVIVGNNSSYIKNGKIITKRGYETKYKEEFNE